MAKDLEIGQNPIAEVENTEEKEKGRQDFDIIEMEDSPPSRQAVESGPEEDDGTTKPGLPFSKARCIALVATVTGASFLNVGSIAIKAYDVS